MVKAMKRLCASLEQTSFQTEWSTWMKRVLTAVGQVDLSHPETWSLLDSLSRNIAGMCWLTQQIRRSHPVPPKQPREESVFYMLAAFCPDNSVLGYVIDTWRHYYQTKNSQGLLSCARILSHINRHDEYPHLNVLYNLMMGDVLREYRLYAAPADRRPTTTFLTERDFHLFGKYLPDFRPFGFREQVQATQNRMMGIPTSDDLARECCMSGSVFRRRFKQEFGMPFSDWLRKLRKERIEQMLRDPGIPLGEVAVRNGFNMLSSFSDYCRRNFGLSPRQLRERLSRL